MGWLLELYNNAHTYLSVVLANFNRRDWVDWAYLLYVAVGLFWIGYQFNRLRGRSDREFDKWVEEQAKKMRRNLEGERRYYLDWLRDYSALPLWWRIALALSARVELVLFFIARLILLRKRRPSVAHAMRLWRAGTARSRQKAKEELETIAAVLESKLHTYIDLEAAKRLEARNAYLYVGRLAEEEGDSVVSRTAFGRMIDLARYEPPPGGDPDAHKLIALQYLEAQNGNAAMFHCEKIVGYAKETGNALLEAEGYRLQARAHGTHTRRGRELLNDSLNIEHARENHAGWGATLELFGDIYRPRKKNRNAAVTWYKESLKHYQLANDARGEKSIIKKLNELSGEETWLSRRLDWLSKAIAKLAMQTRGPPRMP
jgi:hypothetical protein